MGALKASLKNEVIEGERSITHIDPKSALKIGFVINLCVFGIGLVAAALLYLVLGVAGVWGNLNSLLGDLMGSGNFGAGTYFGIVIALGLLELVIFTLLAPVMAYIYNLSAKLIGGLRVTVDH